MPLRRFDDQGALAERAKQYLGAHEAANNLLLGILAQLGAHARNGTPYLAVYEQDGGIEGLAMRTPPLHLLIASAASPRALHAFAEDLHLTTPDLPGVLAEKGLALDFARIWQARTGRRHERVMAERIHELREVSPVPASGGRMRRADARDRPLLVQWIREFQREAGVESPDPERSLASRLEVPPSQGGFHIWEDGGPVSLAGYAGATPTGIRVGPVYTPPTLRGRGYATSLVAALSSWLLGRGLSRVFLYTDLANPTSNAIYRRIGYRPVCDADQYRFFL